MAERSYEWSDAAAKRRAEIGDPEGTTEPGAIMALVGAAALDRNGPALHLTPPSSARRDGGICAVELVRGEPTARPGETGRIEIPGNGGLTVLIESEVDRAALKMVLELVGEIGR